jgi:hypothetical protein
MPITEKLWQQHELWDGTYTLDDLLDVHEAMWVKSRNMQKVIDSLKSDNDDERR